MALFDPLSFRLKGAAKVWRHVTVHDRQRRVDRLVTARLQTPGHLRRGDPLDRLWRLVKSTAAKSHFVASQRQAAGRRRAGQEMRAVTAGVESKVALRALDRARRDSRLTVRVKRPGVHYLRAAERTTQVIGASQVQLGRFMREQVSLLLR